MTRTTSGARHLALALSGLTFLWLPGAARAASLSIEDAIRAAWSGNPALRASTASAAVRAESIPPDTPSTTSPKPFLPT